MAYKVAIKNNATGEIRLCSMGDEYGEFDAVAEYQWAEGNYSCDCNLDNFFCHDDEDADETCGETRYTPLYAITSGGERVEITRERVRA